MVFVNTHCHLEKNLLYQKAEIENQQVIQLFDDLNGVIEELESDIIEYKSNKHQKMTQYLLQKREVEKIKENKFF